MAQGNLIYGWYDDEDQPKEHPTSAPPLDATCPLCGHAITMDDMRTHSIMSLSDPRHLRRSYFYRTHRTCAEAAPETAADDIVLAMIARNGD